MSPQVRPEDDVAERLEAWRRLFAKGSIPLATRKMEDDLREAAAEIRALRSERDRLREAIRTATGMRADVATSATPDELATLIRQRQEEAMHVGDMGARHDAAEEREQMAARVAELEASEAYGMTLVKDLREAMAGLSAESYGLARLSEGERHDVVVIEWPPQHANCSCPAGRSWEAHARCGHVEDGQPATLLIPRTSDQTEPSASRATDGEETR